jgi:peptidoglycan/LPS O-acetylase OafA/YrhL
MEFFATHIANRIPLADPKATVFFIYGAIVTVLFLSISRSLRTDNFLDFSQTQQLRGIAVLLIMLGHLNSNVLETNPYIPLWVNNCGVYLFLFLSGYGLMRSQQSQRQSLSLFIKRRVNRVFIPYWITTILFLLLDYFLLSETYPPKLIALTALGINFHLKLQLLDYARWFITLILFLYFLFYLAIRFKRLAVQLLVLIAVPITVCYLNYFFEIITPYNPHIALTDIPPARGGWNPWHLFILPFPAGFLAAVYIEKLKRLFPPHQRFQWNGLYLAPCFFAVFFLTSETTVDHSVYGIFYSSLIINVSRLCLALFALCLFAFLSSCNIRYRMLSLLGSLSYELYLLHNAFMVKYDFILFRAPVKYSFLIFLVAICIVAYALTKVASGTYLRKKFFEK